MNVLPRVSCLIALLFSTSGLAAGETRMPVESMAPSVAPATSTPATTPSKPLSRAEEILRRFDKNRDGRIDEDERADAHDVMLQEQTAKNTLPSVGRGLGRFQALALELFDHNRDRQLEANERLDAIAFIRERGDVSMRAALVKRFDKNADGTLDEAETRESQTYIEEHRGELMHEVLLKHYDANGNAELDSDEKSEIQKDIRTFLRPNSENSSGTPPAKTESSTKPEPDSAGPMTTQTTISEESATKTPSPAVRSSAEE
jgi:Ca2+-binding EF-hand superfamily protein